MKEKRKENDILMKRLREKKKGNSSCLDRFFFWIGGLGKIAITNFSWPIPKKHKQGKIGASTKILRPTKVQSFGK